ncbi:MAG: outer membrane beta-barrel protein [Gammaproteobacteria bacterium]
MKKSTILAAAIAATVSASASAEGFYLRGFGGYTALDDLDFNTALGPVRSDMDDGFNVGAAAGLETDLLARFAPSDSIGSRVEVEYGYRENDVESHRIGGARLAASTGEFNTHTVMGNFLIDFNKQSPLTFYAGGGLGVAFVNLDSFGGAGNNVFDDDDTTFAYQGIAGVEYRIDARWSLFGEYRYLGMTDPEVTLFPAAGGVSRDIAIDTHNVGGGVRYRF